MGASLKNRLGVAFGLALVLSAGFVGGTLAQAIPDPELLLRPIKPCRVFDTALSSIMAANSTRSFLIAGTGSQFAAQGGTAGGCGIPDRAAAVAISLTSENPQAVGGLVAFGGATVSAPHTRVLSFAKNQMNTATAIVAVENKQIKVTTIAAATNVLGDVTGYFVPQIQALIGGDGAISSGTSRVVSVTHSNGSGAYLITLDRPARSCSPQALTYNFGHYASVGLSSSSTPNVVSVYTWNINSTGSPVLTDESFFLHVAC